MKTRFWKKALYEIQQSISNVYRPLHVYFLEVFSRLSQPVFKEHESLILYVFKVFCKRQSQSQRCIEICLITTHPNFCFSCCKNTSLKPYLLPFVAVKSDSFCTPTRCSTTRLPGPVEMFSSSPSVCRPAVTLCNIVNMFCLHHRLSLVFI